MPVGWFFFDAGETKTLVVTKRREERGNRRFDVSVSFFRFLLMFNMGKKL